VIRPISKVNFNRICQQLPYSKSGKSSELFEAGKIVILQPSQNEIKFSISQRNL